MPEVGDVLEGLLEAMTASAKPQAGGHAFLTDVQPRPDQIEVAEIIPGAVELTWITKDVRFDTEDYEASLDPAALNEAIIGGMPIPGLSQLDGVPGLLGQLEGTLPLLNQAKVSVKLEVRWRVLDDRTGEELDPNMWRAPGGLEGPSILVVFAPEVVELTSTPPPGPTMRRLRAHVKLTAAGVSKEGDLPDVKVPVLPLPIPKVLASFRHSNFQATDEDEDGFVFILVPSGSPLKTVEQLNQTLDTLQTTANSLKDFAQFAAFLAGVGELANAVTAQPFFVFASTDSIDDLNDFTAIQNDWYENDIELENEISSLIFIGPAGVKVELYCETEQDDENGQGRLTVGPSFFTLVRSLHAEHPSTEPGGLFEVIAEADGDPGFGDWLSSMEFG